MIFSGCVNILMGTILYKYGWNHSLDNKFMNLNLTVYRRERRTSNFLNKTIIVQKVVYIQSNFVFVFFKQCINTSTSNYARQSVENLKHLWPFALIL